MAPAVSVILPVYNGAKYLEESVNSILAQSFADFELIAIDDGSTDDSRGLLETLAHEDGRLRIWSRANRGLVATLNEGLAFASAPLVARMDADDISVPWRLDLQSAYLSDHATCLAVGGAVVLMNADGVAGETRRYPTGDDLARRMRGEGSMLAHPTVMMRRDAVLNVGGYRQAFVHAEDYDLWLRLLEHGEIANLPEVLLFYRQHDNQVSHAHAVAQATSTTVAQEFSALRTTGPEPEWRSDIALSYRSLRHLPLPEKGLVRVGQVAIRTYLRPGLLAKSEVRREMILYLRELGRIAPAAIRGVDMQGVMLAIAAACRREGAPLHAAVVLEIAFWHDPRSGFASLYSKLRHRLKTALKAIAGK